MKNILNRIFDGSDKRPESAADDAAGRWVTAPCWHGCGGRCLNKAYVVNGVVVRQKTDDTHADSADFPQQRGCLKGRSQRQQVYAPDRLKYPMKRKHWEPGSGGDRSLRGKDEWVRISWDEALDHVASELKRVTEKYGNRSIFLDSYTNTNEYARPLGLLGGFIFGWGTGSWGNFTHTPQLIREQIADAS